MSDQHVTQHDRFTVTDKRAQKRDNKIAEARKRNDGQLAWTLQAAGAMFWEAEYAASTGRHDIAEMTLAKRTELIEGARRHIDTPDAQRALARIA